MMRLIPGAIVFFLILQCLVTLLLMRIVMTGRSRKMVHASYEDEQVASPKIPDPSEPMNRQLHVAINKGSTMVKSSVNSLQEKSIKDTMPQLSKNKAKERSSGVRRSVNSIMKNLESTEDTMPHPSKNKERNPIVRSSVSSPQEESTKETWAHLSKKKSKKRNSVVKKNVNSIVQDLESTEDTMAHLSKNKERNPMVRRSVSSPQEESTEETWAHLSKKKTKQRNSVVKKNVNSIVQDLKSTEDTMAHLSKNKERNSMVRRSVNSPQEESNKDTWAHWSKNKATSSKLLYSVEKLPSQPKQIVREATRKTELSEDSNLMLKYMPIDKNNQQPQETARMTSRRIPLQLKTEFPEIVLTDNKQTNDKNQEHPPYKSKVQSNKKHKRRQRRQRQARRNRRREEQLKRPQKQIIYKDEDKKKGNNLEKKHRIIEPLVVNEGDVDKSLNPDILERGKFQQYQIYQLCNRYNDTQYTSAQFKPVIHSTLFSDNHRLTFCAVKKAGCTVMYTLFLLLQNKYTLQELENVTKITHEDQLRKVVTMDSLPRKLAMRKLSLYFSFTVVRNPLERLVSAYRNKMEEHDGGEDSYYFFLQKRIISRQRLLNSSGPSYPTFREFIEFHLKLNFRWWDPHFAPSSYLCQPCLAKYNFYASTKSLDDDTRSVLQLLDIPEEYYFSKKLRDKIPATIKAHAHNTSSLLFHYYSQLPPNVKKKLFEKLAFELDYYYSLYPAEHGMHLRL